MSMTAEQKVIKALRWVAKHPDRWKSLRELVGRLAAEGHYVQRGSVYLLACQAGMTIQEASVFKRDHNLWSVLSRYMAMLDPSVLSAVRYRESDVDGVDLEGMWRCVVGPQSFAAGSLAEAREIWEAA